MDIDKLPYIPARLQKHNPGRTIKWAVIHDMESPETGTGAEDCARWFQNPKSKGSAHICVDDNSCVRSVWDNSQAAAAPGSNTEGVHIELTGYARQTAKEWMDLFSVATMENAAECVAQWLHKHNLPNIYRDASALRAGLKGWTTHWQVTLAFKRSTHTDPGVNFPIAYFQSRIDYYYNNEGNLDLTMDQYQDLKGQLQGIGMMVGFIMQKVSKVDFETFERENSWLFDEFLTKDKPADGGPSRYELFLDGFNNAARLEESEDLQRFGIDLTYKLAEALGVRDKLPDMPKSLQASDTTPLKD